MKKPFFLFLVVLSLFVFSCKTTDFNASLKNNFTELSDIVEKVVSEKNYFIVQINLSSPNLEIKSYPKQSGWTKPKSVKKFAKENNCFVAINANPFEQKSINPFSARKTIGTYIDSKVEYSAPNARYAEIAFYKEQNKNGFYAKIEKSQVGATESQSATKALSASKSQTALGSLFVAVEEQNKFSSQSAPDFAFGGFWTILYDETIYNFKNIKDFRSAAALSKDGKTLYLFCGKKLSYQDCAKILKDCGAFCALQLDGGSSSQLYFCGKNKQKMLKSKNPAVIFGFSLKNSAPKL